MSVDFRGEIPPKRKRALGGGEQKDDTFVRLLRK